MTAPRSPLTGEASLDLWWAVPGLLAGMSIPFLHPDRRENFGAPLHAFADELPLLAQAGIGAVVGLLNIPSDAAVYARAGFAYLSLPIPDGDAPTIEQFATFLHFLGEQRAQGRMVAVHCLAGLGRTGTLLAGYLIAHGTGMEAAVDRIRAARRGAIETSRQLQFLFDLAMSYRSTIPQYEPVAHLTHSPNPVPPR